MTSTAASSSSVGDPAPPAPVAGAAGAAGGSYFADQKKGEVNELLTLLRACSADRDPKKKRDVLKKVIAYMTLGVDVSRLFSQMLMAIETRDLVVKKMVYLYLCTYASSNPDLAIMCINTLQRDCSNEDPMVRGLALRSLCSLRLPTVVEYIMDPLSRSLTDSNAYVRKTGVIGVVKLHDLAPERVKEANMVDTLYDMLGDVDQQVVTNCLFALQEIMGDEGGMAISQSIVLNLLSRIEMFNEWGLCQVLGIICRYAAADDDEIFTIMNLLDPVLRTSNSGVVLSTTKCFLHLTRDMPELHRQVYERLKAPLLTLMAGGTVEIMHCILLHVEVLVQRCPGVFDDEFRLFYTRDNDPSNVKYAKVKLLSYLVSESNMQDIVDELSEYVCDPDSEMARRAIRAIGFIAHRLPQSVPLAVSHISGFLDTDIDHVLAETILMVQRLLRKYPDWRGHTLGNLKKCIRTVEEPKARAAAIWMLGQYGDEIPDSPYVIEPIIGECPPPFKG
jgi:AP-4 complex subunit beta-1